MDNRIKLLSAGLAIVGCVAARYAVPFPLEYSIGFVAPLVGVALFFFYRACLRRLAHRRTMRKVNRETIVTAMLSLLFSTFLVLGSWLSCEDSAALSLIHVVAIALNALPIFFALLLLWDWLDKRTALEDDKATSRTPINDAQPCEASVPKSDDLLKSPATRAARLRSWAVALANRILGKRWPLFCFVALLVCWLPVFLAAYPGFFCYDMGYGNYPEWAQFSSKIFYAHHSVFHTLLMGTIIQFVNGLFGNPDAGVGMIAPTGVVIPTETAAFNPGLAAFVIFQMFVIAAVFSYLLATLRNMGGSRLACLVALAYLALNPLIAIFVSCATKDVLFSAITVLLCLLLYRLPSCPDKRKGRSLIAIAVAATLFCLLRPNAVIVFAVAIPFIAWLAAKKMRKALALACVGALGLSLVWLGPVAWALDVQGGNIQRLNALSVPAQQIAFLYQGDTLSDNDKAWLESLGYQYEQPYNAALADYSKWNIEDMALPDLAEAYMALGAKYPAEYLTAFLEHTQMAWNPYSYVDIYEGDLYDSRATSLFEFDWEPPVVPQSVLPGLRDAIGAVSGQLVLQNVPGLALLVSVPFYIWVFLLVLARAIIKVDRRALAPCVVLGLLILSMIIGPCVLVRYYLYLVFGLPLLLMMLFLPRQQIASYKPRLRG